MLVRIRPALSRKAAPFFALLCAGLLAVAPVRSAEQARKVEEALNSRK